jgi:ubiquinone/menaquinone biosynthesis C-methylase UbiE
MDSERNPQARQMGDESMARNLAYQAQAIWPQEQPLLARYRLAGALRILDLGCGTGEITRRLADLYPQAQVVGVDILESNLELARRQNSGDADRVRYETGDAFALKYADAGFDLVVCRHMSQSVPDFHLVLDEIGRVLRRGGWLHLLSEDYAMLRMPRPLPAVNGFPDTQAPAHQRDRDPDRFWVDTVLPYLESVRCDGRIGRHSPALLVERGYTELAVDYIVVDTLRVPREVFAQVLIAWRDGFAEALAAASVRELSDVRADFDSMINAIRTPPQYAVWHVPVISARRS